MTGPHNVHEVHNYFKTQGRACQESTAPLEQSALKPILGFKRNAAARIREDHAKWTATPVHGHQFEILGERREEAGTARVQMAYDQTAERLRCKICERTWPWAFRATIPNNADARVTLRSDASG